MPIASLARRTGLFIACATAVCVTQGGMVTLGHRVLSPEYYAENATETTLGETFKYALAGTAACNAAVLGPLYAARVMYKAGTA